MLRVSETRFIVNKIQIRYAIGVVYSSHQYNLLNVILLLSITLYYYNHTTIFYLNL